MNSALYREILAGLLKSAALENYLSTHVDDEVLAIKTAHDVHLFDRVKEASRAAALMETLRGLKGTPLAQGLGYGAGAMIPVTAGGAYLLHRGGEEAEQASADLRNKALQAALGIGGIGAGLYALHRFTQPTTQQSIHMARDPRTGAMVPMSISMRKQSSVQEPPETLLEKLATVGFLDAVLEEQEKHADENVRKDAHECRMLNAEHGVDLLKQLLS